MSDAGTRPLAAGGPSAATAVDRAAGPEIDACAAEAAKDIPRGAAATGAIDRPAAEDRPAVEAAAMAARLRRLGMRSWRRGMRETDLLLGHFADAELAGMGAADLDLFEALLEENDQDLYAWIVAASAGRDAGPERFRPLVTRIAGAAVARLG